MTERDDELIRDALQELRSSDRADAPEFDAVLQRPRRVRHLDSRRAALLASAAGVVLLAGTAIVLEVMRPPRLVVPTEVMALSSWRPMSDVLIEDQGYPLRLSGPRLGESLLPIAPIDTTLELP